jgi:hypothetical protein
MRAADARSADMRPPDMRRPDMRPADMRRVHPTAAACPNTYSAAVSAKPAAVSTTMPAATASAATAARVCFECEKRHDEEQRRGHASADRQHRPHGAAGLGAPRPRGRLSLGIPPRTKNL